MKHKSIFLVCALLTLASATFSIAADVSLNVNWADFLGRNDLIWDKSVDATIPWLSGATIGNGTYGAVILKPTLTSGFQFRVNRLDINDDRDGIGGQDYSTARLPVGYFTLKTVGTLTAGQSNMRHDLWNNEVRAHLVTSQGTLDFRCFVHATQHIMVVDVTTTGGESAFTFTWTPDTSRSGRMPTVPPAPTGYVAYPYPAAAATSGSVNYRTQQMPINATYHNTLGGQYSTAWSVQTVSTSRKVIYCNTSVSIPGTTAEATAISTVNSAISTGIDPLVTSHRTWWQNYYQQSFISTPDTRLESNYWIQMMRMGSCSRDSTLIVDLMGPWYEDIHWPAVFWEINAQSAYLSYPQANHVHEGLSLINRFVALTSNLLGNVTGCTNCASFSHATAQDLKCKVTTDFGMYDDLSAFTWALFDVWKMYRYSMDATILNKLYPLMTYNMNYYLANIAKGTDGKYHTAHAYSPECGNGPDCNFHLFSLKWLCQALIDAAARKGITSTETLVPQCQDILNNFPPYPSDSATGLYMCGGVQMIDCRHWNHLVGIYPYYVLNWDDATKHTVMKRSLDYWAPLTGDVTGFKMAGAASMYAAMTYGDSALKYFKNLLNGKYEGANTTHFEGGGCTIPAGLHGADAISSMLLQSYAGVIRTFPAFPTTWQDASFHRLLADGGFEVSAVKKVNVTQFVRVKSLAGEPCKVKSDIVRPLTVINALGARPLTVSDAGGITTIDLQKDEVAILYTQGTSPSLSISPTDRSGGDCNCYVEAYPTGTCKNPSTAVNPQSYHPSSQSSVVERGTPQVSLYTLAGRLVSTRPLSTNMKRLFVADIAGRQNTAGGVYLVVVRNAGTIVYKQKMVLAK